MWGGRVVGLLALMAAASLLSGCAGARSHQELARLQSQVGLLDERVTQLERSTLGSGFSGGAFPEPGIVGGETVGVTPKAPKAAASTKGSTTATSLKPTTREIQQALTNAGFYQGAVDGKMGPVTREAIKEFQRVHGLTDDGVVGKRTWAKLKAYADLSSGGEELNAAEILK